MPMQNPVRLDDLFFLGILLLFLMISYNMPLSNIYINMVYLSLIGYVFPIIFNWWTWIKFSTPGKKLSSILWGVGVGIAFIYVYLQLTAIPMNSVFATTIFGDSELMGQTVFTFLISTIESVFFFVIIPSWILYKVGLNLQTVSLYSIAGVLLILFIAVIFVAYHLQAKGVTDTTALMATFVFGSVSMAMVLFFKEALPMVIAHITTNGYSTGFFEVVKAWVMGSNMVIIIGVIVGGYYLLKRNKVRLPFGL